VPVFMSALEATLAELAVTRGRGPA
jgi:hypothetical protein